VSQPLNARWQALLQADAQATAIEFGGQAFRRVAGLKAGDIVAWLGANSVRSLALLLACERVGCVLQPLNWRLAPAELATIVQHAGARCVWADEAMQATARELDAAVQPQRCTEAGDLLLVYTSGTTGQPKGAVHTGQAMAANVDAAVAVQALDHSTRALAVLPLFHVGGLCIQTLPTLLVGGTVLLQERFEPRAWLQAVAMQAPTTSLLVPATMRALIEHPQWHATDLSALRFVNSGSQIVPLPLIQAFHARGVPVAQVYGATETGPVSIALRPEQAMHAAGSVGEPALGVQVRLVDAQSHDVSDGEVGEIWLRGANLMRDYHRCGDPQAFADGWFRTGDLAYRDAQGRYTVVGRSEIENLVAALPGVAECAVVGVPDARWGEVPWLAVVMKPGAAADEAALRASYEQRLARFKHPKRVVWLEGLPKTALGKVKRDQLAERLTALALS
jgi:fatty-acyl-CoA synthase